MKTSIAKVLFIFLSVVASYSCKKKKETVEENSPIGNLYRPDRINGFFAVNQTFHLYEDSLYFIIYSYTVPSWYCDTLISREYTNKGSDIGQVSVNNVRFAKDGVNHVYFDSTCQIFSKPALWKIEGSKFLKAFEFVDRAKYPTYKGSKGLLKTLKVFAKNEIDISDYRAETVKLTISDRSRYSTLSKTIQYPNNKITLDSAELSDAYIIEGPIEFKLEFFNNNYQLINGKVFRFRTGLTIISDEISLNFEM